MQSKNIFRWTVTGISIIAVGFWFHRYNLTYSQFISNLKDIAIAWAAIYTAIYGARALDQWRKELLGTDKYKLAKKIGNQATEVARLLHFARSYRSTKEIDNRLKEMNMEIPVGDLSMERKKIIIDLAQDRLLELEKSSWEALLFGIDIRENIDGLWELVRQYWFAWDTVNIFRKINDKSMLQEYKDDIKIVSKPHKNKDGFGEDITKEVDTILDKMSEYMENSKQ